MTTAIVCNCNYIKITDFSSEKNPYT